MLWLEHTKRREGQTSGPVASHTPTASQGKANKSQNCLLGPCLALMHSGPEAP